MRKRERHMRSQSVDARIEMTPMIDVVFLLLVFFLVAARPLDVISGFDTTRPTHRTVIPDVPLPLLTIAVCEDNRFTLNGTPMTLPEMDAKLGRIARYSTSPTVLLKSATHASHGGLVRAMDICHAHSFTNLLLGTF